MEQKVSSDPGMGDFPLREKMMTFLELAPIPSGAGIILFSLLECCLIFIYERIFFCMNYFNSFVTC